jgi:pimeloyl-ACP methyl ester carboxylesterase
MGRPALAAGTVEFAERWTIVDGLPVFSRIAVDAAPDGATPLIHVHGFGISGSYLLPTARLLATDYPTYVPDLPGYGRSMKPKTTLTIPELGHAMAAYMDAMGIEKANFIGNSMGCLIIIEFAHAYPDRIDKAILVSPAGGPHNQPIYRGLPQLARDSFREPIRMYQVAVPDYLRFGLLNCLRLFHAMVHFPTIDRLIELKKPVLIVVGVKDPLISKERMKSALDVLPNLTMVFHTGAAHAVNYSHPGELASVARNFIEGEPIDIERAGNSIEVIGIASQVEQAV